MKTKFKLLLLIPIFITLFSFFFSCVPSVPKYTVSFDTENGSLVPSQIVYENEVVVEPKDPYKDAYIFAGWYTSVLFNEPYDFKNPVTSSFVLYALWETDYNALLTYTVTFVQDGEVLQELNNVPYGTTPVFSGITPTKNPTFQYDYVFAGWSPNIKKVTEDITYTAVFDSTIKYYQISFVDSDDTLLLSDYLYYGETPSYYKETPNKESDPMYDYVFAYWSPNLEIVTQNVTYKAVYESIL
ncbi:MAG: InlB B-repeat-containing protein, partial [Acholeplasmatales bacterium]|nr:InlB B-repeat-containing protein [Acholeplasmatales bacterium]